MLLNISSQAKSNMGQGWGLTRNGVSLNSLRIERTCGLRGLANLKAVVDWLKADEEINCMNGFEDGRRRVV